MQRIVLFTLTLSIFFLSTGFLTSPAFLRYGIVLFLLPGIYFIFNERKTFFKRKSHLCITFLALTGLISFGINFDHLYSAQKSFIHLRSFLIGALAIAPFTFWITKSSERTKKILYSAFLLSVVISSLNALKLFLGHGGRTGGFLHIMAYGYGLALILPILLGIILNYKNLPEWLNVKFTAIALVFGFIGLLLTQARGAFLGLLISFPFVIKDFFPRLTKVYVVILCISGTFLGANYFFGKNTSHNNRLLMSYQNESDSIRRTLWTIAGIATLEKPILGWGPNNYRNQVSRIIDENNLNENGRGFTHAHNLFLQISTDLGLVGLGLFLTWIFFWLKEIIKSKSTVLKSTLIPMIAVILTSGQFEYLNEETTGPLIFFIYALSSAIMSKHKLNS